MLRTRSLRTRRRYRGPRRRRPEDESARTIRAGDTRHTEPVEPIRPIQKAISNIEMIVALAMAYGRILTARSAQARICCISISSIRSGDATLDPESWNSLGAPTRHLPSADAPRTRCATAVTRTGFIEKNCSTKALTYIRHAPRVCIASRLGRRHSAGSNHLLVFPATPRKFQEARSNVWRWRRPSTHGD